MPDCEQTPLDIPPSAAQPASNHFIILTRPDGTSYSITWNALVNWLGGGTPMTPPTASAGADNSITLPTSSIALVGSGTGGSGTITGYQWTHVGGPSSFTIVSPNSASTNVTGLSQGTHTFRLTVTNSNGQTAQDDVNITVAAAAPTFNTELLFDTFSSMTLEGVTGTMNTTDAGAGFQFNKITPATGTPMAMNIYVTGALVMVVDFPSDYLGQQCRFRKTGVSPVLISFTNGNVNL